MTDIIDETGRAPRLKNRRVTMFDVMLTMRLDNTEYQFKEVWNISDAEVEEVREYVEENREELRSLELQIIKEREAKN